MYMYSPIRGTKKLSTSLCIDTTICVIQMWFHIRSYIYESISVVRNWLCISSQPVDPGGLGFVGTFIFFAAIIFFICRCDLLTIRFSEMTKYKELH